MYNLRLAVVMVCAALCGACAVKQVASKALAPLKKAKIELRCAPKVAVGSAFGPVAFMALLRVKNPGEKYWCPAVEWYVNGSRVSRHEIDCDPYETAIAQEGREPEVWSEPMVYFALRGGKHTITARLLRSDKVIASESCVVEAR